MRRTSKKIKSNGGSSRMLNGSLEEVKAFILWAKEQGIDEIKVGEVVVHFHPKEFMDEKKKAAMQKNFDVINDPKSQEISLDNPILFDAGM